MEKKIYSIFFTTNFENGFKNHKLSKYVLVIFPTLSEWSTFKGYSLSSKEDGPFLDGTRFYTALFYMLRRESKVREMK